MDINKLEKDETKLKENLSNIANKIWKNRKNSNEQKETEQLAEIKKLLNLTISECESLNANEESTSTEPILESLESYTIPLSPPAIDIIEDDKVFSLFDEESLSLKNFVDKDENFVFFGKSGEVPKEDLFRKLIAHDLAECVSPVSEECHSLGLYVLYLLSVHTDRNFVSACVNFLRFQPFEVRASEVIPIFVNFGSSLEALVGSNAAVKPFTKWKRRGKGRRRRVCFPTYNAEMVANVILDLANSDLVKKEPELKLLITALTRLTLDWKIRSSHLLSAYSCLISVLSSQLAQLFDPDEIASCLHLEGEHILNQVEITRSVFMPISSTLHEKLVIKTIDFILKSNTIKISDSIKAHNVISILKELVRNEKTQLEIYCILQLLSGSLPTVTATLEEADEINNLLLELESGFFSVKDSFDLIRLKLEIAKLRNLVTTSVGQLLSINY